MGIFARDRFSPSDRSLNPHSKLVCTPPAAASSFPCECELLLGGFRGIWVLQEPAVPNPGSPAGPIHREAEAFPPRSPWRVPPAWGSLNSETTPLARPTQGHQVSPFMEDVSPTPGLQKRDYCPTASRCSSRFANAPQRDATPPPTHTHTHRTGQRRPAGFGVGRRLTDVPTTAWRDLVA